MADEDVAQFTAITGASATDAANYMRVAEGRLEAAIELFYANDGASLPTTLTQNPHPVPPASTRPSAPTQSHDTAGQAVIDVDSDQDYQPGSDEDVQVTGTRRRGTGSIRSAGSLHTPPVATPPIHANVDDDEAMARRLQEEFYGSGGAATGDANRPTDTFDADGYRAPIQRTTETLVGPDGYDPMDRDELNAAVAEQMMFRRQMRQGRDRPGIFNQSMSPSVWDSADEPSSRSTLSRATGGASDKSAKANSLAEMYRPPFELMSKLRWDDARSEGKENEKWILINIQDPSIFDCQVLNRDIWKNSSIMETVRENFYFLQYSKDDQRGSQYTQYYFQNKDDDSAYPHIAIVDPRTGEQVKKWSGSPAPKAPEFLMQLHEFLDRYSLSATARNPVARRKPERKPEADIGRLTEEQQLEMAMQASLAGNGADASDGPKTADDPDDLTRSFGNIAAPETPTRAPAPSNPSNNLTTPSRQNGLPPSSPAQPSVLSTIPSSNPHTEPPPGTPDTTRIQFRHPNGRLVRRFLLSDPVRRIFEWLRATPIPGTEGKEFELVFMQRNLIDGLDETIEGAGLKNGTVMVEILDG